MKKKQLKRALEKERALQKYREGKEDIFTLREASYVTGIEKNRLMYMIKRGQLQAKKLGWIWSLTHEQISKLKDGEAAAK